MAAAEGWTCLREHETEGRRGSIDSFIISATYLSTSCTVSAAPIILHVLGEEPIVDRDSFVFAVTWEEVGFFFMESG